MELVRGNEAGPEVFLPPPSERGLQQQGEQKQETERLWRASLMVLRAAVTFLLSSNHFLGHFMLSSHEAEPGSYRSIPKAQRAGLDPAAAELLLEVGRKALPWSAWVQEEWC